MRNVAAERPPDIWQKGMNPFYGVAHVFLILPQTVRKDAIYFKIMPGLK